MSDEGEVQTNTPDNSTVFSTRDKDPLLPNYSSKLPSSDPEEKWAKNKILSVFSGTEKGSKKKGKEKPIISSPSAFQHTVHVDFDAVTNKFTGMPKQWSETLKNSERAILESKKDPLGCAGYFERPELQRQEPRILPLLRKKASSPSCLEQHQP